MSAFGSSEHAAPRSVTCPYLRLDAFGALYAPGDTPSEDHRCVAIAGPRIVSRQQQDLMCLRGAHVDCPRYRRATDGTSDGAAHRFRAPRLAPATSAALIVLALSAALSFGFVIQRGGIDLPTGGPSGSAVAAVAAGSPLGSASGQASTPAGSLEASPVPSNLPSVTASPSPEPSSAPSATPAPTASPTAKASPKPAPTPGASGVPSADRLAVIKPCPGQPGCWIYNVRAGDNLWSIAHWFGVPLDTVYAWNPTVRQTGIHAGMPLKIPTPTR